MTETTTKRRSLLIGVALGLLLSPYAATAQGFDPAKTPWGDPDLRGHYLPGPYQALETPTSEWTPPEGTNRGQGAAFSRFFEPDPDAPALNTAGCSRQA